MSCVRNFVLRVCYGGHGRGSFTAAATSGSCFALFLCELTFAFVFRIRRILALALRRMSSKSQCHRCSVDNLVLPTAWCVSSEGRDLIAGASLLTTRKRKHPPPILAFDARVTLAVQDDSKNVFGAERISKKKVRRI